VFTRVQITKDESGTNYAHFPRETARIYENDEIDFLRFTDGAGLDFRLQHQARS
jgi:hypothetical protein